MPGSGVLQDLDPGLEPTIRDLAILMTVVSDNQGTDLLYNIVGTERIHAALDGLGLTQDTRADDDAASCSSTTSASTPPTRSTPIRCRSSACARGNTTTRARPGRTRRAAATT